MNIFTIISIIGVYLMQIIGDIVGLIIIGWTTQLNIIMIESIIL